MKPIAAALLPLALSAGTPSPSLSGLPDVSDGTDGSQAVQPAGDTTCDGNTPCSAAPDVVGAFRFICTAGQVLADDPIVYPGQPGASHLHQFYGNEGANAASTFESLRRSGKSTCNRGMDVPGNRSAYWMPAMLDGAGQVVKPAFVSIYYKRRPASDPVVSDPRNPKYMGKAVPLPNGLRFIFGYDMLTNKSPTGSLYFSCDGSTAGKGHYETLTTAGRNCPAGNRLGAIIIAPTCWDGKNLDSPNHRDHVAYASYGGWGYEKCPRTHPYVIPQFTLGAWYEVDSDASQWSLSSDAMRPNLPKGTTFHADYWEAWNPAVKAMWHSACIDRMLNCSAGELGNGLQLKGAAI